MQWPYQVWGADAVLAGHDHTYERIVINDFPYFVNGLGGRSIYNFSTPVAGSQVRYNGDYGAMLVEASAAYITFQFITRTGAVIDTYTRGETATATPTTTATATPTGIGTSTPPPTHTSTNTVTPTETATDTPTPTATEAFTLTATSTPTDTPTLTATSTPTATPSDTPTPIVTDTPTLTTTSSPTDIPTLTATHTSTAPPSDTPTPTATDTPTPTPTATATPTPPAPTQSATSTQTPTRTPTTTPTAIAGLIYADGFESGNLSAWSSSATDSGDLSASLAAALAGTYGMQAVIDDNNAIYVTDDTPNTETHYLVRFDFDPNSITMTNNDAHYIFSGYSGATTEVLRVEFRSSKGSYQLRAELRNDRSGWKSSSWFTISDASHSIEVDWRAATANGANNGSLTLWIDGAQRANLSGVDNDARRLDRVRLGAVAGIDTGTRGVYFFDGFESRR